MMTSTWIKGLFDTERYPVGDPDCTAYRDLVARARKDLDADNCARLPGFIRPDVLEAMQREARGLAPRATYTEAWLNPYFSDPPEDCPENHPLQRFALRCHGMVRGDLFDASGAIWLAFQDADLCGFVADCLGHEELFSYRDPFGCVNVNVQSQGREFSWHFDHNDFTVSILLDAPDGGGVFEYVPDIRTGDDERYDAVERVLDGDRSAVRTLALRPGDLQLFRGGNTLHRVTAPTGETQRLSLLLSYVTDPGHIASPAYAERLWGEVHPRHLEADGAASGAHITG
ncbi:MAG: hypothetical protein HN768_12315 [Rhodospirillaceae bacterium]|nr:hypothetical protein [Rhodospirillaceae bacterium]